MSFIFSRVCSWFTINALICVCFFSVWLIKVNQEDQRVVLSIPSRKPIASSQKSECNEELLTHTASLWSFWRVNKFSIPLKFLIEAAFFCSLRFCFFFLGCEFCVACWKVPCLPFWQADWLAKALAELSRVSSLISSLAASIIASIAACKASFEVAKRKAWSDRLIIWLRHRMWCVVASQLIPTSESCFWRLLTQVSFDDVLLLVW